ncbi:MAG: glycerophosphodiester phosphodiesterase family protein [Xanthobacteraceae bacterium]
MSALDWLTARPVAHRGLHDGAAGVIENTASAFTAAIAANYAIECDLQLAADGEAMVHHDDALERLTEGTGALASLTAAELKQIPLRATSDRMLTVGELCDLVAGRATLVIELKSQFDGDLRLAARAADVLSHYAGPAALMSFDPALIAALRALAPELPRGIVAERNYSHHEWKGLSARTKRALACFQHALKSRPQFIAYSVKDLPAPVPRLARHVFRLPVLTWTVRTDVDRARAARYADQMIFEGFRP